MERFIRKREFSSLSVQDLLEARDHYHVHISNLPNVIGTAVGRYRIRKDDENIHSPELNHQAPQSDQSPRTLANSKITPWSWPSVLVFVEKWASPEELAKSPQAVVPPRLYLPDGRVIPTCVILAKQRQVDLTSDSTIVFPTDFIGGGCPIFMDEQNVVRRGTAGCLVSDGTYFYVLTSRHVVGHVGSKIYSVDRGTRRPIGITHAKSTLQVEMRNLYRGFAGGTSMVTLDAGLVKIDEPNMWTCQVYGVGRVAAPVNISADTLSLDLIGCPVFARDIKDKKLEGEIQGLFFRYAISGDSDLVAELLIGPREGQSSVDTRPGDSGSVWFWDSDADDKACEKPQKFEKATEFRPLGIQWGGLGYFSGDTKSTEFALASTVSAVCKELGVEVMRDWNVGHNTYWGKTGHYKVGYSACFLSTSEKLDTLLKANAESISVSDAAVSSGELPGMQDRDEFIALADVADLVWRNTRKMDEANHFADMDQPGGKDFKRQTLLELWDEKPASRNPSFWTEFYDSVDPQMEDKHRGALPFRVRDIYKEMVKFVNDRKIDKFVCAAGILAHYVGDACQPLHISYLHHGHPDNPDEAKVHSIYETAMLDRFAPEVVSKVAVLLQEKKVEKIFKGEDLAADAVVRLMKRTIEELAPEDVVDCYLRSRGHNQLTLMWNELGEKTCSRLADGAITLATIWESAWKEGGGDSNDDISLNTLKIPIEKSVLKELYQNRQFIESKWLRNMDDSTSAIAENVR